jgi:hypothetical protein
MEPNVTSISQAQKFVDYGTTLSRLKPADEVRKDL